MKKQHLQIALALILIAPLIFLTVQAVSRARNLANSTRQKAPLPSGFPVEVLREVPKDYAPDFKTGFTVVQIGHAKRESGTVVAAITTTLQRSDGSSLVLTEPRDGNFYLQWTAPNGERRAWSKNDASIKQRFQPVQQHTARELLDAYARASLRGVTFAIYKGVLCHTDSNDFEKTLVAPELGNMFLWVERKKYLLETISLTRGEPDPAQWNAIMAKVPTGLPVVAEPQ